MDDSTELYREMVLAIPDQRLLARLRREPQRQALMDRAFYSSARLLDREDEDSRITSAVPAWFN